MKRVNVLKSHHIEKLEKEMNRVLKMQKQINDLKQKIADIQDENDWFNYLGKSTLSGLTDDESVKLNEITQTIKYIEL